MATSELISVWICCSCCVINSDRFCKMMNVTLMALMAGDTANVTTHHALVGVCLVRCVLAYTTILRRWSLKNCSRHPKWCVQRFVFLGHLMAMLVMRLACTHRKIENDQANLIHSLPASSSAVDLMTRLIWCSAHQMWSTGFSVQAIMRVTRPVWRPVIVFSLSSSDDMPISLARHLSYNMSRNLTSMLKILPVVWRLNMGITTRCRLRSRPWKQMRTRRLKNDWPRCVLPSPANDIAQTDSSSRQSTICCSVEPTKMWTYSPTIRSVMLANLAILVRSLAC